jgi:hypothetical protein
MGRELRGIKEFAGSILQIRSYLGAIVKWLSIFLIATAMVFRFHEP